MFFGKILFRDKFDYIIIMNIGDNDSQARELRNKIADLNVRLSDVRADLMRLERKKKTHQMKIRRLTKEIKRRKLELSELQKMSKTFDDREFELKEEQRLLKKQLERALAELRTVEA